MSAYAASLPGSFAPPFFSFGGGSGSSETTSESKSGSEASSSSFKSSSFFSSSPVSSQPAPSQPSSTSFFSSPVSQPPHPSSNSSPDVGAATAAVSAAEDVTNADTVTPTMASAFPSWQHSSADMSPASSVDEPSSSPEPSPPPSPVSSSSGIIVAILSASVDPVSLLRSLSGRSSSKNSNGKGNVAKIVRSRDSADTARGTTPSTVTASSVATELKSVEEKGVLADRWMEGRDFSYHGRSPSLCRADDESQEDDDMSFYDYDDDDNDNVEDDNEGSSSCQDDCANRPLNGNGSSHPDSGNGGSSSSSSSKEEDDQSKCIQFELSIAFQGRKYTATRAFPRFVQLRNDLMNELGGGSGSSSMRRRRRSSGGNLRALASESSLSGASTDSTSTASRVKHSLAHSSSAPDFCQQATMQNNNSLNSHKEPQDPVLLSIPELPSGSTNGNGANGTTSSNTGVYGAAVMVDTAVRSTAGRGFAFVQAAARTYAPDMEVWLQKVVEVVPYSPSLGQFLWEPLDDDSYHDGGGGGDFFLFPDASDGDSSSSSSGSGGGWNDSSSNGEEGGSKSASRSQQKKASAGGKLGRSAHSKGSRLCVLGSIAEMADDSSNDEEEEEVEEEDSDDDDDDGIVLFF